MINITYKHVFDLSEMFISLKERMYNHRFLIIFELKILPQIRKAISDYQSEVELIKIQNAFCDENGLLKSDQIVDESGAVKGNKYYYTKEGRIKMKEELDVLMTKEVSIVPFIYSNDDYNINSLEAILLNGIFINLTEQELINKYTK